MLRCGQWPKRKGCTWSSDAAGCRCWEHLGDGSRCSWLWEQLFSDQKATLLLATFQGCEISLQFLVAGPDVLIASFSVTSVVSELHLSSIITDSFLMWGHASLYIQPFAGLLLDCNCIGSLIEFLGLLSQRDCKNLCCIQCGLDYLPIKVQGKHLQSSPLKLHLDSTSSEGYGKLAETVSSCPIFLLLVFGLVG